MEALADQMIAVVIGTALDRPWAAVVVDIHPLPTTTTMTVVVPLVATVLAAMTTADALRRLVSFMIGVKEDMDVPHRVVAWEDLMSMVHRARATLTILTIPGPDHLLVAMTTLTSTAVTAAHMRQDAHLRRVAHAPVAREAVHHMMPRPSTHLVATSNAPFS